MLLAPTLFRISHALYAFTIAREGGPFRRGYTPIALRAWRHRLLDVAGGFLSTNDRLGLGGAERDFTPRRGGKRLIGQWATEGGVIVGSRIDRFGARRIKAEIFLS